MARPSKPPWAVTWKPYGPKKHLRADFKTSSGKRKRKETGTHNMGEAMAIVQSYIEELQRTEETGNPCDLTLAGAFNRMFEETWQYQKDWQHRQRQYQLILKWFGHTVKLKAVNNNLLSSYEKYLRDIGNKGSTINRKMSIIRSTLKEARDTWEIISKAPKIKFNAEVQGGHKRAVTEHEFKVIIDNCDTVHRLIFKLMMDSGMRVSECDYISRDHFDVINFRILLKDTKNGTDRYVPVSRDIFKELLVYINKHGPIQSTQASRRYHWQKGRRKLRLMNDHKFTPGALRHTFGLTLSKEKYPANVIQAYLGHKSILTTQSYISQTQDDLLRVRDEREPRLGR